MTTILLMGVSGGNWLPLLFILIGLMAGYNGLEWLINYMERAIRRSKDIHLRH